MNRTPTPSLVKWTRRGAIAALVLCGFGCSSPMSLLWFLNRGDGKVPAQFKFEPIEGKKELVVAVVVTTHPSLTMTSPENVGLDRELSEHIAKTLTLESAKSKLPLRVVDNAKVMQIKRSQPALWETGSRCELASKLGADYLLEVYVSSFVLNSRDFGGEITTGSSSFTVSTYRAGKDTPPLHNYQREFNPELRDARSMSRSHYRSEYIRKLGEEIARRHVEHTPDRDRPMER